MSIQKRLIKISKLLCTAEDCTSREEALKILRKYNKQKAKLERKLAKD
jgi:hypothetical protein|tara:strand:+ start:267 stop:410 length:144 start_codon:yes stop_codon:yes gene_type:complete